MRAGGAAESFRVCAVSDVEFSGVEDMYSRRSSTCVLPRSCLTSGLLLADDAYTTFNATYFYRRVATDDA